MNVQECLVLYGQAWFESDHERRVEVLRQCCTDDIVFMDPQLGRLVGLDAVAKMIGGYYDAARGDAATADDASEASASGRSDASVSVEVVTPIDVQHGFFRYSFVWRFPDGTESGGTDFCELADDGRMKLITVWGANDDFPLPLKRA